MRKLMVLLVLMLTPALAQSIQVSVGSPFGLNVGVKFPLVPLVDARVYGGFNPLNGALGGGADVLVGIPLTDLYAGGGAFFGTRDALSLPGTGTFAVRGVVGTYLNVGLPLIGVFVELHPMLFFSPQSAFGIGAAAGVNIGF